MRSGSVVTMSSYGAVLNIPAGSLPSPADAANWAPSFFTLITHFRERNS